MIEAGRLLTGAALLAAAAAWGQTEPFEDADPRALREIRDALLGAEDFSAALGPAERVVDLTGDEPATAAVEDLMRLARIQAELDMFADAERNYIEGIERLRAAEGEFSERLVPAYRALGRAYLESGDFTSALTALEQAQHISQRGAGLYNLEQSDVIDEMTLAHLRLGNTLDARDLQLERLENAVRQFGPKDLRVVPFRDHLAEYYARSRLSRSARALYAENLAVQQARYGELDPRLLPTLRALLGLDLRLGEAGEAAARIERILEANEAIAPSERAESLAVLGDRAIIRETFEEAASYYARAFDALERKDPAAAAAAFAEPRMLDFVAPLSAVDRATRRRPYAWGTVVLEFDVSADGRAANLEIAEIEPEQRIGAEFVRRVQETRFRPRLVDGAPAATRGVRFSHPFRYYVARDDD